jgi:hypothetical protein
VSVVTVARSVLGKRKYGCADNPKDERDKPFSGGVLLSKRAPAHELLAASSVATPLSKCAVLRYDQGYTGSCVAQAFGGAVCTRETYLANRLSPSKSQQDLLVAARLRQLSRRALYSMARGTHGATKVDGGTYIRAAAKMLRRHGCPLESQFGWSELLINQKVPFDLVQSGYEFAELEWEVISATGDEKIEQIQAATLAGYPVVFGTQVYRSFERHRGDGVYMPGRDEAPLGGHAMYLVHIEPDTGHGLDINSWGRSWGDDGGARVHVEWIKRDFRDLTVIKNWRRIQSAVHELRFAA